jgi:MFS family permease
MQASLQGAGETYMATAVADTRATTGERANPLLYAIVIVVAGLVAVQLGQPLAMARLPLRNLLKNELHVARTANAAFFFWIGLAWYFKPLAGIITDAFPIFGSRRRTYILGATTLSILAWLALCVTPHRYGALLGVTTLIDAFLVITSVVVGGYMVETAQRISGTGRFASVFNVVSWGAIMISGPIGGYLASKPFNLTPIVSAAVMVPVMVLAPRLLREQPVSINSSQMLGNAGKHLVSIFTAGTMWAAAGLLLLFYAAPAASTALFYRQQDVLHLDTQAIGNLQFLAGLGSVAGALAYGLLCKKINLKHLLLLGIMGSIFTNLPYLLYTTYFRAAFIDTINGVGFTLAECALFDLAIRATPKGSEALGFSLFMSARNLALFGSDTLGSWLMDKHNISFNALVILNSATTAIVVPLIFLLPAILLLRKDAEATSAAST